MKSANRRTLLLSTIGIGAATLGKTEHGSASSIGRAGDTPAGLSSTGNSAAHPRTSAESAAGVTPTNYGYLPGDVRRYGADPSGSADSGAAFADASKAGEPITATPGTYLVNSELTIGPTVIFQSGATLKPARDVTIVFSVLTSYIQAGPYQIFDLSLGGVVSLPQCNSVCPAEWWGAKGDYRKLDNEVPINQALLAVHGTNTAVSGGEVTLERGGFFISGTIYLRQNTWLRGKGKFYTVIKPGVSFRRNSYMIIAKDESRPMFNCPIVDLRLDANDDPNILAAIYAPAWQQKCGTQNVYISNFKKYGIQLDTGYGGAAQLTIRQTEIYTSADPLESAACISADYSQAVVGWIDITLQEVDFGCAQASVSFASSVPARATSARLKAPWPYKAGSWNVLFSSGESRIATISKGDTVVAWSGPLARNESGAANAVSPNAVGISANGRIVLACLDVHSEFISTAFILQNTATVSGTAIKCDGNSSVQELFKISANWTGTINATSVKQAGAKHLIVDLARPYPLADQVPHDNQLVWPPSPARPFATANVTGGAMPTLAYSIGIAGILHVDVGIQRLTMAVGASDLSSYDVSGTSADPSAPILCVKKHSATTFDVLTRNAVGTPIDAAEFSVKVYHRS